MKKLLLLGVSLLVVASAGAQTKRIKTVQQQKVAPKMEIVKSKKNDLNIKKTDYSFDVAPASLRKAPRKETILDVWYTRPAGVFSSGPVCVDGVYMGEWSTITYFFKPFKDYTFTGYAEGMEPGEELNHVWQYFIDEEEYFYEGSNKFVIDYPYWCQDNLPFYFAVIGDPYSEESAWWGYQSVTYSFDRNTDPPVQTGFAPNMVMAMTNINDFSNIEGYDVFWFQKTFVSGGRFGDNPWTMIRYTGLKPFDPADGEGEGYWFGKNAGSESGTLRVDGIAQAFEKPEHPYLLKSIGVDISYVRLEAPVEFTCKVYKLDEIPEYSDDAVRVLPAEPGELIATGTFTASPEMVDKDYQSLFLNFSLMGHDSDAPDLEYEITPTIDYPILVVLDNYNDESMSALKQFTTFVNYDWDVDEGGFGETAYLKIDEADEEGVFHGDYVWAGLNNFLGPMKTAFNIAVNIEHPFIITYLTNDEEYTFPDEGGEMIREFELEDDEGNIEDYTMYGVDFVSTFLTGEGDWFLTCDGDEDLPSWLHLKLEDQIEGAVYHFTGCTASADPLPEGVTYREATIRFEIPGDYIDYTFKQGTEPEPQPMNRYDVNQDGEVNIADVNTLIAMILGGDLQAVGDVNEDGEVTLADVNTLIDYILNN